MTLAKLLYLAALIVFIAGLVTQFPAALVGLALLAGGHLAE